jgi:hypothetical protein
MPIFDNSDGSSPKMMSPASITAMRLRTEKTDEGKAFLSAQVERQAKEQQRQFRRDVERAARGDEGAIRALERSAEGRRILKTLQEDAPLHAGARQAELNDARRKYYEVLNEQQTNPQGFYERITHPQYGKDWIKFMAEMQELDNGNNSARNQIADRETISTADDLYDELRDSDDDNARRLLEEDWEALAPSNFTGTVKQRTAAMSRLYGQLVAKRAQERAAAPVAERVRQMQSQAERVRSAPQMPNTNAGANNPAQVPWEQLVETYIEQSSRGSVDPHVNRAFLAGMQQRGHRLV